MKKVLVIVIDALATRIVEPAMAAGRLPNFRRLVQAGALNRQCTAIFPSITPAATCSIATGCYPSEHGIAGAYWYDEDRDRVAFFGDDIWPILEKGVASYMHDFQVKLNRYRLRAPTIFELLEGEPHLRDACVNFIWYRGTIHHPVNGPLLLKLMPGVELDDVMVGPHILCLGDFVSTRLSGEQEPLKARGGLSRRYGFQDETSADYLLGLAERGLPDFTLAYFPDNDFDSHREGPQQAESTLQDVDAHLGALIEICGGLEKMLDDVAILITGDHSQSDLHESETSIDLAAWLKEFTLVDAGSPWQDGDDIMACPNMRAAQIYLRDHAWENRQAMIDRLLDHDGIDQVIWRNRPGDLQSGQQHRYHVATSDRGKLEFWQSGAAGDSEAAVDPYGAYWKWQGDLAAIDAGITSGELVYGAYPNALERIQQAFFDKSGHLWATARLGREFCLPGTSVHARGSHGSLHALDSSSPLIAAGLPAGFELPENPRTVDVMPISMALLGLEPPRAAGASFGRKP